MGVCEIVLCVAVHMVPCVCRCVCGLHTCAWLVSGVLAGFGTLLGSTLPRQPVGRDKLWHVRSQTHRQTDTHTHVYTCTYAEQLLLLQLLLSPIPELLVPKGGVGREVRRGRWKRRKRVEGGRRGKEMLEMRGGESWQHKLERYEEDVRNGKKESNKSKRGGKEPKRGERVGGSETLTLSNHTWDSLTY